MTIECSKCEKCANFKPKRTREALHRLSGIAPAKGAMFWESGDVPGAICLSIENGVTRYIRIHTDGTWEWGEDKA